MSSKNKTNNTNNTNNKNNINNKNISKKIINNRPYALSMKDIQQNEVNYITNKALQFIGMNKIVGALNPTFSSNAIKKNIKTTTKPTTNKNLAHIGGKRKKKGKTKRH